MALRQRSGHRAWRRDHRDGEMAREPRQAASFSVDIRPMQDFAQEEAAVAPLVIAPLTAPAIAREGS